MFNQLLDIIVVVVGRVDLVDLLLGQGQLVVLFGDAFPLTVILCFTQALVYLHDFLLCCQFLVYLLVVKLYDLLHSHVLVNHLLLECVEQVLDRVY